VPEVVRRSGVVDDVGGEFWRAASFVERIYVYLILWRLAAGTRDRTYVYDIVNVTRPNNEGFVLLVRLLRYK